jgi:hypothetical protein
MQTEVYNRWLDNVKADGPLPVARTPCHVIDRIGHMQGMARATASELEKRRSSQLASGFGRGQPGAPWRAANAGSTTSGDTPRFRMPTSQMGSHASPSTPAISGSPLAEL